MLFFHKILSYKINNRLTTLVGVIAIILLVAGNSFYRNKELEQYGQKVVGQIVKCDMIRLNGACTVLIRFETKTGKVREERLTLYKEQNCQLGKYLTVEYSTQSEFVRVIEK